MVLMALSFGEVLAIERNEIPDIYQNQRRHSNVHLVHHLYDGSEQTGTLLCICVKRIQISKVGISVEKSLLGQFQYVVPNFLVYAALAERVRQTNPLIADRVNSEFLWKIHYLVSPNYFAVHMHLDCFVDN